MKRILIGALSATALFPFEGWAQNVQDPCSISAKSSAAINVVTATTTSIVAVSGTKVVYVCGFAVTIAGSATTAASAKFEYGTGAACSSPTDLTGVFGSGDAAVSTTPTSVNYGDGHGTIMSGPSGAGICIVTAGNAVDVQGVLTYVQQ